MWVQSELATTFGQPAAIPLRSAYLRLQLVEKQILGLECSACGKRKDPRAVHMGSLAILIFRLEEERFAQCPSCTQAMPLFYSAIPSTARRWDRFVTQMIGRIKREAKCHEFEPRFDPSH